MRGLLKQSLRLGSGLRGTAGGAARGYKGSRVPKDSFGTYTNRGPSKVRWHARASEAVSAARKRSPRHGWRRSEGLQGFAGAKRQFRNVIKTEVRPR